MTFRFRFASVLKLRRHQETMEQQKLAMLIKEQTNVQQQIDELKAACRETADQTERQSVRENRQQYAQKHVIHQRLMNLRHKLNRLAQSIYTQRQYLAEANKKMQMMEKLKEREKQAFINHYEHLEQLQQNEIAIQRYNSNY